MELCEIFAQKCRQGESEHHSWSEEKTGGGEIDADFGRGFVQFITVQHGAFIFELAPMCSTLFSSMWYESDQWPRS